MSLPDAKDYKVPYPYGINDVSIMACQIQRDALEAAAKIACYGCREGRDSFEHLGSICHWESDQHIMNCAGAPIRALMPEEKP